MSTPLFLGIDGGATKTRAVVVNAAGNVCGEGEAGCGNHSAVGYATATANIYVAAETAVRAAGSTLPCVAARIGLAGVDRPADQERFLPALAALAPRLHLSNDAVLALTALPDAVGIAVIAGTGSIALGADRHGTKARAGGWGWRIGDEGSGYAMGRQALQAATQAADGRAPDTALLPAMLAHWQLAQPGDLIGRVYRDGGATNAEIAALASLVFAAAREGDSAATRILRDAADGLARMVLAVAAALNFTAGPLPLACVGGLLTHDTGLRPMLVRRLRARRPVSPIAVVADPAMSAARAARALVSASSG